MRKRKISVFVYINLDKIDKMRAQGWTLFSIYEDLKQEFGEDFSFNTFLTSVQRAKQRHNESNTKIEHQQQNTNTEIKQIDKDLKTNIEQDKDNALIKDNNLSEKKADSIIENIENKVEKNNLMPKQNKDNKETKDNKESKLNTLNASSKNSKTSTNLEQNKTNKTMKAINTTKPINVEKNTKTIDPFSKSRAIKNSDPWE